MSKADYLKAKADVLQRLKNRFSDVGDGVFQEKIKGV